MGTFLTSKRLRAELQDVADQLGLMFDAEGPFGFDPVSYALIPGGYGFANALYVLDGDRPGGHIRLFAYATRKQPDPLGSPLTKQTTSLTCGLADLARPVPFVMLRHGKLGKREARIFTQTATGHPGLDDTFTCLTRSAEVAQALANPRFADVMLASPPDVAIELTDRELLVVCDRRKPDRLPGLTTFLLSLRDAVREELYAIKARAATEPPA